MTPDGSLVGVQINPDVLVRELASGTTTMAQLPLATPERIPLGEPLSFSLGSDGDGYMIAVATELQRDRQSVLTVIDPSTGGRAGVVNRSVQFFGRRITAFTALGQVAPDRTPPRTRFLLPLRVSARALLSQRLLPLRVNTNEAGAGDGVDAGPRPLRRLHLRDPRHPRPLPLHPLRLQPAREGGASAAGSAPACGSGSASMTSRATSGGWSGPCG